MGSIPGPLPYNPPRNVTLLAVIAPVALATLLGFCLTPIARWVSLRLGAIEEPDPRRVHRPPMPRLGGLAVLTASGAVLLAWERGVFNPPLGLDEPLASGIAIGLVPVVAISLLADIRGVRAHWKAVAHLIGALIAVSAGVVLDHEIYFLGVPLYIKLFAVPLSALWIVGITNAFILVDGLDGVEGMDGLSAGLALISAASLGAVFLLAGEPVAASCVLVLAGALLGFLPFNAYAAKIFLGDTGAAPIGFVLACFALKSSSTFFAGLAAVLPLLVLVTLSMRSRLYNEEP